MGSSTLSLLPPEATDSGGMPAERIDSWTRGEENVAATLAASSVIVERIEGIPRALVETYAAAARRHCVLRELESGYWIATVVHLEGAYGEGDTSDAAEAALVEAVIGWVAVRRRLGLEIPPFEGLDLNPNSVGGEAPEGN